MRGGRSDAPGPAIDALGRIGLVSYGIVHVVVAWLAVKIALGSPGAQADAQGAVAEIAGSGAGAVGLVVIAVGLVAFAVWQLAAASLGFRWVSGGERRRKRVGAVAKAIAMLGLAGVTTAFLVSGRRSGDRGMRDVVADLLRLPAGRLLVLLGGVAIVVVAITMTYTGVRRTFMGDLDLRRVPRALRLPLEVVGAVGHLARALALAVVGVLVGTAAVLSDADRAGGLDAALRTLAETPLGPVLLVVVALGFGAFGLYCAADAALRRA
ncbi:hypothetical protein PSU4_38500 [Pseudonocardia sulfidoxydans NBRC 16205]|uniref:DUF1206 domain-containing protein n=1 Tax=Pseudonocardia sulfidoxydans NBRC 16205 TaxID=1223511 RepID=A0A511DJB7_9PSEU|nr:hypothetical protein PSU4_38500 [Pseudonocardia sulfidoxydans NBRC 16205]